MGFYQMEAAKQIYFQKEISLKNKGRGCHYITKEILDAVGSEISKIKVGLCHLMLLHTSASISLNECYDSDVLVDMEKVLDRLVPESPSLYTHTSEGKDDMPAHAKCSLQELHILFLSLMAN
eukprot:TRINITY_DN5854_c0_g1_i5.p1 TRINITY_DN5854_c0_g1~~TRINITY_DN5854_c0_g1_i5.p1  ORF type:complete len:122 (-),score=7.75 TRINITY_DN5854_c0_g1_i5:145-510(-)